MYIKIAWCSILRCDKGFQPSFLSASDAEEYAEGLKLRVSMGWWLLRLSAKILAVLRLSVNFFQLRLTRKLKINLFCFKKLNIN